MLIGVKVINCGLKVKYSVELGWIRFECFGAVFALKKWRIRASFYIKRW